MTFTNANALSGKVYAILSASARICLWSVERVHETMPTTNVSIIKVKYFISGTKLHNLQNHRKW